MISTLQCAWSADAVGGVAEQPAPQFRMVAVANDNQVVAAFLGEVDDDFGGVAGAAFAGDFNALLFRQFRHFAVCAPRNNRRRLRLRLRIRRANRRVRQRLPHPERRQLGVVMFGGDGGAFKRGLSAFRAVVTHQNFLEHELISSLSSCAGWRGFLLLIRSL